MSKTAKFKVFCIEQYKIEHKLSGEETLRSFEKYGVLEYIETFFDVLHSYGAKYLVQDIELFINARNK